MKKSAISVLALFVAALICSGPVFSQQNGEDQKFQKTFDNYLDELWKFYPTAATMAGYHKYDDKIEDLSEKNLEKRYETLSVFNQDFVTKIDINKLSPEYQIDHQLIIDALDVEILKNEQILPWDYNPLFYNNILLNSVRSLVTKDFGTLEERAKCVASRLGDLPGLLKQAKENLKTPPQLFTEKAVQQFAAINNFYSNVLREWIAAAPASQKDKLQSNYNKLMPELQNYENFLRTELLARSTGTFRLSEAHARLMRITFQNNIPLQVLIERAKADYNNIRREMFLCCLATYKIMDPKINIEQPPANLTDEQLKNEVISHVLNRINVEHVGQEGFLDKLKADGAEIGTFIRSKQLADLPDAMPTFETMPSCQVPLRWSGLSTPGVYDPNGDYVFYMSPFTDDMSPETVQQLQEEYNDFFLYFWTVRNVYPGQFVPLIKTRTNPSLLRKLYPNMPLIRGWAASLEEIMVTSGFKNYDTRIRLNQLKLQLRTVIDFITEFNVHEAAWSKEDALAYMMRGGFQTQAEAERKWNQIALNPGYAAYTYVGLQEILDLESEYRKMKGDSFDRKEFLDRLLSHGAIPFRFLKDKVLR